jgi:hypothetical protein
MGCELSSGRIVDCKDSVGGIKTVYIAKVYKDMPSQTDWVAASNDTVTAVGSQTFYQFDVRPETSSLTVSFQSDPANGTTFFEQSLSVTLQKIDATDIEDIRHLCQGRPNMSGYTIDFVGREANPVFYAAAPLSGVSNIDIQG